MNYVQSEQQNFVSSYVDVAPNEYVLKYAYNRNFLKLCINDEYLMNQLSASSDEFHVDTYNKKKTYKLNEYVFYKTTKSSQQFYLLQSLKNLNTHKPLATVDQNGNITIINSDWWKIVGIPYSKDTKNKNPKGIADEYVIQKKNIFQTQHEQSDDTHATRELGIDKSTLLFKNLTNIDNEQTHFMYPSYLQSVNQDNTVQHGYLRKWENGLLEYDIVFKVGVVGKTEYGKDLISANNFIVPKRNDNTLYFKEDNDYALFSHGDMNSVVTDDTKQVNLNTKSNAYIGNIKFQEPFIDNNYMIFTTNVKNIDIESMNTALRDIHQFDNRLCITGLELVGYKETAEFKTPLNIPSAVVNIHEYAMSQIEKTENYPVIIKFEKDSNINIINEGAFSGSKITEFEFPSSLRYIAQDAFHGCSDLSSITFNLKRNPALQPRIDLGAFYGSQIVSVTINYENDNMLFGASYTDQTHKDIFSSEKSLEEKLRDHNIRISYGLKLLEDSGIYVKNSNQLPLLRTAANNKNKLAAAVSLANEQVIKTTEKDVDYVTIDVNEFLRKLNAKKTSKTLFAAPNSNGIDVNEIVRTDGLSVVGFDNSKLTTYVDIDLSELESTITAIADYALSGATYMSSLFIPANIIHLGNMFLSGDACDVTISATDDFFTEENAFLSANIGILSVGGRAIAHIGFLRNFDVVSCMLDLAEFEEESIVGKAAYMNIFNPIMNEYALSVDVIDVAIDIKNGKMSYSAMYESEANMLQLTNISTAIVTEDFGLSGLDFGCFNGFKANKLVFPDIRYYSQISTMFENENAYGHEKNSTYLENGIVIQTQKQNVLAENDEIHVIPDYLIMSEDQKTVLSCRFLEILIRKYRKLFIPTGVSTIEISAFCPPPSWPPSTLYDLSVCIKNDSELSALIDDDQIPDIFENIQNYTGITEIDVPYTVKTIGEYAFARNANLNSLVFDKDIELSSIGNKIISGCENLQQVAI